MPGQFGNTRKIVDRNHAQRIIFRLFQIRFECLVIASEFHQRAAAVSVNMRIVLNIRADQGVRRGKSQFRRSQFACPYLLNHSLRLNEHDVIYLN